MEAPCTVGCLTSWKISPNEDPGKGARAKPNNLGMESGITERGRKSLGRDLSGLGYGEAEGDEGGRLANNNNNKAVSLCIIGRLWSSFMGLEEMD